MPMKGAPPATSTAQSPQPSRSISALILSTRASLSAPVALAQPLDHEGMGVEGGERRQVLWAKGRRSSRAVEMEGGHRPDRRAAQPASAFWACSAAQR